MKFRFLLFKRWVEDVLMFPLILTGRLIAAVKPLEKEYRIFFFFPFFHTGGAEKVHALVAKATGGKDCVIFFTRKSHNQAFYKNFEESGCTIKDISSYTDNKLVYFINIIFRGIISGYINRQSIPPLVFNGQCNFGYKISPWIAPSITQVELIHSISNFSYIRIPFLPFISRTVMISRQKIHEHLQIYRRFAIPALYDKKIHYIANASEFEKVRVEDKDFSQLRIFYSGRATVEKRPHLFAKIAERVHAKEAGVAFEMAGDSFEQLDKNSLSFIRFRGNISNEKELASIYKNCNIVLLTSSTEGFPLAVIEGMAYGCCILATPVGDLPTHITDGENGFLFSSVTDEEKIIAEATNLILQLYNNRTLLQSIAANNIAYAQRQFSFERFALDYQKILIS